MPAIVTAAAERDRGEVRERQDEELDAGRDGEQADARNGDTPSARRLRRARLTRTATATRNTGYASASDMR